MRVLVTGGTGFVGGNVIQELRAKGHEVFALVRSDSPRAGRVRDLGAQIVPGDIVDPESLRAIPPVDAFVHLVGIIRQKGGNTFPRVHADAVSLLMDAASRSGARKFVHMSALGTRPGAASEYHKTKWQGECNVRAVTTISHTIFRPAIIFGREAWGDHNEFIRQMLDLHGKIAWLLTPVAGSGKSRMQPVWVGDVARFFVDALTNPQMRDRTFELGGPRAFAFQEIQDILCRARHGKVKWHIHFPLWYMKILAFGMELVLSNPPVTRDQLKMVPEDNTCDMTEALKACPMTLTDLEEWCGRELARPIHEPPRHQGTKKP